MRQDSSNPSKQKQPSGFTMVELLVAIGIIALLVSILAISLGPSLQGARVSATKATIRQIGDIIKQRQEAIEQMDLASESKRFAARAGLSQPQALFILKKNLLRQALPQTIEDLWGLDRLVSTAGDNSPILIQWQEQATPPPTALPTAPLDMKAHSSEVLFYALTSGSSIRITADGKSFNLPTLSIDQINSKHVGDTNGNGLLEFLDDWGEPLQFYLWPTRLLRPTGNSGSLDLSAATALISGLPAPSTDPANYLNVDSDDPSGMISTSSGITSPFNVVLAGGGSVQAVPFNESNYHTLHTYHVPLLVSSGPDMTIGLPFPASSATARLATKPTNDSDLVATYDNITNHQP